MMAPDECENTAHLRRTATPSIIRRTADRQEVPTSLGLSSLATAWPLV